jgi:stearoyl-CoA desaturase (delta-9 desaturase)
VAVHRVHHALADRQGDPHSPSLRSFEILAGKLDFSFNKWTMRRMVNEPFHRWLHDYYFLWLLGWALVLIAISPTLLFFGFLLPAGILLNVSSLSNYLNHKMGYRNFETGDDSTNNILIALLAWGEGWHNNHHRNPNAWNLRTRWWELDPTAWVISQVRDG